MKPGLRHATPRGREIPMDLLLTKMTLSQRSDPRLDRAGLAPTECLAMPSVIPYTRWKKQRIIQRPSNTMTPTYLCTFGTTGLKLGIRLERK